jgi:hypothetical protein
MKRCTGDRALLAAVWLGATTAWAQPQPRDEAPADSQPSDTYYAPGSVFFLPGVLGSGSVRGSGPQAAAGLELSLHVRLEDEWGVGSFFQLQRVLGAEPRFRGSLGAQFAQGSLGFEVGVMREEGTSRYARTLGLHIAPFFSIGFAAVSLRLGIPLDTARAYGPEGRLRGHGFDVGLVLALKWLFKLR